MPEVIFWGGTGQAKVLHEAISGTAMVLVAIVDNRELVVSPIPGVPVLQGVSQLDAWLSRSSGSDTQYYVVAIGGGRGKDRLALMDLLQERELKPLAVTHRTAFVACNASVGEGAQILAQSAVCADVRLGRGVIINTAASVDHDSVIGDGVHIGPGARLAGEVTVEDRVFIGTGAIIMPRIHIGKDATVGAGAVVTRDVDEGVTVLGNPARVLYHKQNNKN